MRHLRRGSRGLLRLNVSQFAVPAYILVVAIVVAFVLVFVVQLRDRPNDESALGQHQTSSCSLSANNSSEPYYVDGAINAAIVVGGVNVSNGVLVASNVVATAAHSVSNFKASKYSVRLFNSGASDYEEVSVRKVCMPSRYSDFKDPKADVALLQIVDISGSELFDGFDYGRSNICSNESSDSFTLRGFVYGNRGGYQAFSEPVNNVECYDGLLTYRAWSERGVSGSPVFDGKNRVIALHIQSFGEGDGKRGVILTRDLIDGIADLGGRRAP